MIDEVIVSINNNKLGHTSYLKVSRLTCFWIVCVVHSNHCWWPLLVLLDLSSQDLSNGINIVIIRVFMCL